MQKIRSQMRAIMSQGWSFIFVFQLLTRLLTGNLEHVDGEHEDNQACPVWVDKRKAKAPDPGPDQRGRWWPWGRGHSPSTLSQRFPSLSSPNRAPGLVRVEGISKSYLLADNLYPRHPAFSRWPQSWAKSSSYTVSSHRSLQNSHRRHSILCPETEILQSSSYGIVVGGTPTDSTLWSWCL